MSSIDWQSEIEQTVQGLGYVLVDIERASNGLLRVFFEHGGGEPIISLDDCERVTRQLQYVLEAGGIDYQRLEVSSPGLDRPLKKTEDFDRFLGELVDIIFKRAVDLVSANGKPYQQKRFTGLLAKAESEEHDWVLLVSPENTTDPRQRKKTVKPEVEVPELALGFSFDEVREAKLAPVIDFKNKKI